MAADYEADLELHYPSEALASAVAGALSPEAGDELPKARSTVARAGATLTVAVRADDAATLRAAVNAYLRWAKAAEDAARLGRSET